MPLNDAAISRREPVRRHGLIGVLTGGNSRERDRSLLTARDVADALLALGHRVQVIDTAAQTFLEDVRPVDTAFLAIAGRGAEDGTLQGFLETIGIPHTGSGVLASALAMHKPTAKTVAGAAGVPVLAGVRVDPDNDPEVEAKAVIGALGAPVIVKPEAEGSSIDITVAHDEQGLAEVLVRLRAGGQRLLAEPFVEGRAVTIGVLDNPETGEVEALPIVEVSAEAEFYDHTAKLDPTLHTFHCPADLPAETAHAIAQAACLAHTALGCSGYSRSDFVIDAEGRFFWLEVNTLPGLRKSGTLPLMAETAGIGYERLIQRILDTADGTGLAPGGDGPSS